VKVNEVTSWGDYAILRRKAVRAKQERAAQAQADALAQAQAGRNQALGQFKPNPARATEPVAAPQTPATAPQSTPSKLGAGWVDTSLGISIKPATQKDPTFAYYQKKYYILSNSGQWLTDNRRPIPDTKAALLNQALEQL